MERYMMNRQGNRRSAPDCCSCPLPQTEPAVPAMAYVPYQIWQEPFALHYALQAGTIFPDLCKPFCGRRMVRR